MSDAPAADVGSAKTPADFLKSIRGKSVVVKLNSGVDYRGILACLDGYMNIAMEQTEVRPASPRVAPRGERNAPARRDRPPLASAPSRHPQPARASPPTSRLPASSPTPRLPSRGTRRTLNRRLRSSDPSLVSQEYVNGQLKNKYGDAFIRGNNVLYISTVKGSEALEGGKGPRLRLHLVDDQSRRRQDVGVFVGERAAVRIRFVRVRSCLVYPLSHACHVH